jgi:hypothetical protein
MILYMIPGIVILLVAIIGSIISCYFEKKEYNKGVCSCGNGWFEHRDDDSQGGSMWKCTACDKYIWTSWI